MFVHVKGPFSQILGRLALIWIPYDNPIIVGAFIFAATLGLIVVGLFTYYRLWGYLWREWVTTLDHKKIGLMYMAMGAVMLFRGFIDAMMMRSQQAMAAGPQSAGYLEAAHGYLPPFHFDQIYGSHGTIMLLFAVTPLLIGLMNIIVPLQCGSRDMAYPYLNAVGLYLTAAGAGLIMTSLFVGEFSHAAWIGITPLTEMPYSPGVGVDYWLWALQISGIGTTLGAINLVATIVKNRTKGLTWARLPIFSWTALTTSIIALTAFPALTATLGLLTLDRYFGTHFFTAGLGGNVMLYTNLFWIWGHPEVYFIIMPGFGIVSEIVAAFSHKRLFGYTTMVLATFAIAGVSWSVWLHHFFVMGQGPGVNSFFGIATMLVGIPTGVKLFNWILTMYRGRIEFEPPMLWAIGAVFLLPIGGMTGVMLAMAPADYQLHNSVFVIAHFHTMVLLTVFALLGAISFWFPKVFGFKLDPVIGRRVFWLWVAGSLLVFIPMYCLGFAGMTRRLSVVDRPSLQYWFYAQEAGIFLYCLAAFCQFHQFFYSFRHRRHAPLRAPGAWAGARSLEWLTRSPVPFYNFAVRPVVHDRDEWTWRKEHDLVNAKPAAYVDITMPKNTLIPALIGFLSFVFGFAMVWRIWWLGALSFLLLVMTIVARAFVDKTEYTVSAAKIERIEQRYENDQSLDEHETLAGGLERGKFAG